MLTRTRLQQILGFLWLLDGVLQLKSPMFTDAFVQQVILPNAASQPAWIASSIHMVAHLMAPHIAIYNGLFAAIQLSLGLLLIAQYRVRWVLAASIAWAMGVWWVGEGFGQLFTGQTLLLTGAPGAVSLYAIVAWALWPRTEKTPADAISDYGRRIARWSLASLWFLGAALHFQSQYLTPNGMSGAFMLPFVSHFTAHAGIVCTCAFAVVELSLGVLYATGRRPHLTAWFSIVLSLLYWWIGQNFGQMLQGLGTDPNAAPLFILLTLCATPDLFASWRLTRPSPVLTRTH